MRTRRNIARRLALVIPLVVAGCSSLGRKDTSVARELAGDDACGERPAAERAATVFVNRSGLGHYPTLNVAVSECFEASDTGAVMLSLRVSRQGAVCQKSVRQDSTGRPAAVSCFLRRFVHWEIPTGDYRLVVDLNARAPTSSEPARAGGLPRG